MRPSALVLPMVQTTELQNAEDLFNQRKYSDALIEYRKALTTSPAPTHADAAKARYGIAFTLAYADNPQRNYADAIQELDERRVQIIVLYYHEHLTMKQIAEVLEITESRVSQLHASALFNLSARLEQWKDAQ